MKINKILINSIKLSNLKKHWNIILYPQSNHLDIKNHRVNLNLKNLTENTALFLFLKMQSN